ncbi:MAG: IS6 family transposase [Nitrosopumilus sp. D6]|nr:MAG: IS6 family transposase [Nitrosopumilus sp. D6]
MVIHTMYNMNKRQRQAQQLLESEDAVIRMEERLFKVRSLSNPVLNHYVTKTGHGLTCTCDDHQKSKSDCSHIHVVLKSLKINKFDDFEPFRIMEMIEHILCPKCRSGDKIKWGINDAAIDNNQDYRCKDCGRKFTPKFGFERMRYKPENITLALDMYCSNMSYRKISNTFMGIGIDVSHTAVMKWVKKYSQMITPYVDGIMPRVGEWFRADEVWIRVKGKKMYLFACMDDDTRFWISYTMEITKKIKNANALFEMVKKLTGKSPRYIITDGHSPYKKSSKQVFGKDTEHIFHIHLKGDMNNNMMERLNRFIRDREINYMGLKTMDSPALELLRIWYNFVRPHMGLGKKTPAEMAWINVTGRNKWKTLIQNASLNKATV